MPTLHHVLLDTDIGSDVDDAMALAQLCGTDEVALDVVTTVYGDTALRSRLAVRMMKSMRLSAPVFAGAEVPMSGREVWWAGHEGALHENLDAEAYGEGDAVDRLIERVVGNPGLYNVLAIGPLTNIAAAIDRDERFAAAVRHLWIMGGAFTSDEPEHNFRSDIVAAKTVFASGIPMTVTGLEVTRQVEIRREQLERIGAAGELGRMLFAEIEQWWKFWNEEWNVPHDPVAVLTLTNPELFRFSETGTIEIDEEGRSVFVPGEGASRIVEDLDAAAVAERIVSAIVRAAA